VDGSFIDFDLKVSIKSTSNQSRAVLGYDSADYDNYIYWLTYRKSVLVLGAGYSTRRLNPTDPEPQLLLGVGSTIPDLVKPISSGLARYLRPLEVYYFNFHVDLLR